MSTLNPVSNKRWAASEFEQPANKKNKKDDAPTPQVNTASTLTSLSSSSSNSSSRPTFGSAGSAQVDLTGEKNTTMTPVSNESGTSFGNKRSARIKARKESTSQLTINSKSPLPISTQHFPFSKQFRAPVNTQIDLTSEDSTPRAPVPNASGTPPEFLRPANREARKKTAPLSNSSSTISSYASSSPNVPSFGQSFGAAGSAQVDLTGEDTTMTPVPHEREARKQDSAPISLSNSSSTLTSLSSSSSNSSYSQSLRSTSSARVDLTNRASENLLLSNPRSAGSAINPQGPLFAKPAPSGRKVETNTPAQVAALKKAIEIERQAEELYEQEKYLEMIPLLQQLTAKEYGSSKYSMDFNDESSRYYAHYLLAYAYSKSDSPQSKQTALDILKANVSLSESDVHVKSKYYWLIADIYLNLGGENNLQDFIDNLKVAFELVKDDRKWAGRGVYCLELGRAYTKMGDLQTANAYYVEGLRGTNRPELKAKLLKALGLKKEESTSNSSQSLSSSSQSKAEISDSKSSK